MSHPLVVHYKHRKYDVYVGRPTQWGNPFEIGRDGSREEVVRRYEVWLPTQAHLMAAVGELRGKVLGCWCAPDPCHADVLARLANVGAEGNLSLFAEAWRPRTSDEANDKAMRDQMREWRLR